MESRPRITERKCDVCGRRSLPSSQNPGWMALRTRDGVIWRCPECSRAAGAWTAEGAPTGR